MPLDICGALSVAVLAMVVQITQTIGKLYFVVYLLIQEIKGKML